MKTILGNKKIISAAIAATFSMGIVTAAEACTRILWNTEDNGTFVSRTMDWSEPTNPHLLNIPKNSAYQTHLSKDHKAVAKYDVTAITTYGQATDGINSMGLSGNYLYDDGMQTEDVQQGGEIGVLNYMKHLLAQFATVEEAITFIEQNPAKTEFIPGIPVRIAMHLSLQDTTGDAAIIEFREEGAQIWHGPEYTVMTNQPDYNQHLANVERSKRGWGESEVQSGQTNIGTGGNTNPEDRFVHATYFASHLTEPSSIINGMLKLESAMFKVPHDAPNKEINGVMTGYATEYSVSTHLQTGETLLRYQWGDNYTQLQYNVKEIQASGKNINFQLVQPGLIGDATETIINSGK